MKISLNLRVILYLLFFLVIPFSIHAEWVFVDRVIDGDTFVLSDSTKVRIRNIDTPETNHPYKPKEKGGDEAKKLAKFFLEGNYVYLRGNSVDKYGRRLATVKLRGGKRYEEIVRAHGYDKRSGTVYSRKFNKRTVYNKYSYSSMDMEEKDGIYYPKSTISGSTFSPGKKYESKHNFREVDLTPKNSFPLTDSGNSIDFIRCSKGRVPVKGYCRKDGTYVKPYCRRK